MTAPTSHTTEERLDRAYAAYLYAAARLDQVLATVTARLDFDATTRLREASRALSAEVESTAALALTIAAGAPSDEIETATETARAAGTACALLLAGIYLVYPARLHQAAEQLMEAAIAAAYPTTVSDSVSAPAGLAVAS